MSDGSENDDSRPHPFLTALGELKWTDELVAELREAWNEGHSATVVSDILFKRHGVRITRSAIVGKVSRLRSADVAMRSVTDRTLAANLTRRPPKVNPKSKDAQTLARRGPAPLATGVIDAVLSVTGCRWPVGDLRSPDFHFCDGRQVPGSSYCEHHLLRSIAPAAPAKAKAKAKRRWRHSSLLGRLVPA